MIATPEIGGGSSPTLTIVGDDVAALVDPAPERSGPLTTII
jgi:hypothetical protein